MANTDPPTPDADDVPVIRLNGRGWRGVLDFYAALFDALESPVGHGHSPDALVDSIVWGGMNGREPPYRIIVTSLSNPEIRAEVSLCGRCIAESRQEYRRTKGEDVKVSLELGD
jgi:hypothetical protein